MDVVGLSKEVFRWDGLELLSLRLELLRLWVELLSLGLWLLWLRFKLLR